MSIQTLNVWLRIVYHIIHHKTGLLVLYQLFTSFHCCQQKCRNNA